MISVWCQPLSYSLCTMVLMHNVQLLYLAMKVCLYIACPSSGFGTWYCGENIYIFYVLFVDHTLGNTLRYLLMELPETDFCGYSVPHPYEPKMNVRLQTKPSVAPSVAPSAAAGALNNNASAIAVLRKGLNNLVHVCDALDSKFDAALNEFHEKSNSSNRKHKK